jgi:hypothetical protein
MTDHRAEAKKLMAERELIEQEISLLETKVADYAKFNFDQPLVDNEGFPRADLDYEGLRNYREIKQRLLC